MKPSPQPTRTRRTRSGSRGSHPVCDPVFADFTGTAIGDRLDIDYRYFVPTSDRWGAGDRHVTCFIVAADGSPLNRSHRAAP